jgi:hypothetical protein
VNAALEDSRYDVSQVAGLPDCMYGLPQDSEVVDSILPDLTLQLYAGGNTTVSLTMHASQSYLVPYADANGQSMWCGEVIDAGPAYAGDIGLPVMRNFITIFDLERDMIGFAPPVHSRCPSVPQPQPAPPARPSPHRTHVLLYALGACAGAACALAAAASAVVWYRRRVPYHKLTTEDSQEGNPLYTPLVEAPVVA